MVKATSSPSPERRLSILMAASEAVPFAKTGGLADVAGALPRELVRLGHSVRLVIPHYAGVESGGHSLTEWGRLDVPTPTGPAPVAIYQGVLHDDQVPPQRQAQVWTVRYDPYFNRPGLYQEAGKDYADNLERFALFSRAVMELLLRLEATANWAPDILHAHDWQTALTVVYLKSLYADYASRHHPASVYTIHNLGYQGIFPASAFSETGLPPSFFTPQWLEFYGSCNLMKGGLLCADVLSTVSETYSREIQTEEFGFGLEGVLRERRDRMVGVVNGIDTAVWNPATDPYLPFRYSAKDLQGKQQCKAGLQRELGLPVKRVPMIGAISRLSEQKGQDLIAEIVPELMALNVQLVLLGTGDPALERQFRSLQDRYPDRIAARIAFDEGLAHRIEAASDLFLMPSRYEPCGLSQLYSLRYGTVPVARRTGGLADTIVPYSPLTLRARRATGFLFREASADSLLMAVLLALSVHKKAAEWRQVIQAGMKTDVSWAHSAEAYDALYHQALNYVR
jgi:starch synthase